MATNDLATRLTNQQRADQLKLRTATVRDMLRAWQLFDPADITGSWPKLEPFLVALIQSRQPLSARIAANYVTEFRRAEQIAGTVAAVVPDVPLADLIVPNLRFVGPGNALNLVAKGRPASVIAKVTLTNVEGEVSRQVLNGGREAITGTVRRDPKARGYTRVTDGAPCSFCALLAGRGPVYNSEDSGDFQAHRKCGCTAEPVYFTDSPWPPSAAKWDALYSEAAKAVPRSTPDWSAEVRREFRRRYEATATT